MPPSPDPGPSGWRTKPGYAWLVLIVLVGVYTLNWLDRYIFIILMEPMKQDLGISDTVLGLLSGFAFAAVYSIAGIPIARWADRGNRRSIIAMGLGFWSLMTAVCGTVTNAVQLALARIGVGLGEAACSPPAHSLISDYFPPRRRATAFAIYGLGVSFGITLGLSLGGWISEHYGWRMAFIAVGCPGLLFALIVRFVIWEPTRGRTETEPVDCKEYSFLEVARYLSSRYSFVAYAIGLGLLNSSGQSFDYWSPVFLMRVEGMGSAEVGAWTGFLGGPAGLLGTIVIGVLADRLSNRDIRWYLWITVCVFGLMVPSILMFLYVPGQYKMLFYFISIFFLAAYLAPFIAITQKLMPLRMRALSSAVLFVFLNFIGAFGPFLTGLFNDLLQDSLGREAVRYSIAMSQCMAVFGIILVLYGAYRLPRDFEISRNITE